MKTNIRSVFVYVEWWLIKSHSFVHITSVQVANEPKIEWGESLKSKNDRRKVGNRQQRMCCCSLQKKEKKRISRRSNISLFFLFPWYCDDMASCQRLYDGRMNFCSPYHHHHHHVADVHQIHLPRYTIRIYSGFEINERKIMR